MNQVRDIKKISEESAVVKSALSNIIGLGKPDKEIKTSMSSVRKLNELDNDQLEEYLGLFTAWQNYFDERLTIAEAIEDVAKDQVEEVYSLAYAETKGSTNEKKDLAKKNPMYLQAVEIRSSAKSVVRGLQGKFNACDRSYKAVSRILAKRLKLRYD